MWVHHMCGNDCMFIISLDRTVLDLSIIADLPSIHALKTFKLEDVYGAIVQCWRKLTSTIKSSLKSDISQILNMSIAFLLQVAEDVQVYNIPSVRCLTYC